MTGCIAAVIALLGAMIQPALAQGDFLLPRAEWVTFRDCPECPEMVTLPSGLSMSRAHVTRGQFAVFVRETGLQQGGWGCIWRRPDFPQNDDHPVVCISWNDAKRYAEWLAKRTARPYRLPTLEEMQSAIMGGEIGNYWWGQDIGANRASCLGCGSQWDGFGTAPAGSFAPNPFGLYDAVGNVWTWTEDCQSDACTDHLLIGGSWNSPPGDLRLKKQVWNGVDSRFNTYGIRVVIDAVQ